MNNNEEKIKMNNNEEKIKLFRSTLQTNEGWTALGLGIMNSPDRQKAKHNAVKIFIEMVDQYNVSEDRKKTLINVLQNKLDSTMDLLEALGVE